VSTIRDILPRLRKVRRSGRGWIACCPVHQDDSPSLSIGEGRDGRILLFCHGGCSYQQLAAALGLGAAEAPPAPRPHAKPRDPPRINALALWQAWRAATPPARVDALAAALGVSTGALDALGAAWAVAHNAWAFPMLTPAGDVVGIRLRAEDGKKRAVTGSRQGLFLPVIEYAEKQLYICEGPTDTAAALTVGLDAIGRPSCRGMEAEVVAFARRRRYGEVVVVSDNDGPGVAGAMALAAVLPMTHRVWIPPAKDIREMVAAGASLQEIESSVNDSNLKTGKQWHSG
jgi:phage/plasmid primase-like uncharacterized protein